MVYPLVAEAPRHGRAGARGRRRCRVPVRGPRGFPETREQRRWWHKIGNVLNAPPKSAQPGAKKALAEICNADDKEHAQAAANVFAADYGTKWPKAYAKITDYLDGLLAFSDHLAEHWIHLRTTNLIESTFATVRLRQRATKPRLPRRRVSRWRSSSSNQQQHPGLLT